MLKMLAVLRSKKQTAIFKGQQFNEEEKLQDYENQYLEATKPHIFHSTHKNSILVEIDEHFEQMCITLENSGVQNARHLTVYEFKKRIEFLKNQNNGSKLD